MFSVRSQQSWILRVPDFPHRNSGPRLTPGIVYRTRARHSRITHNCSSKTAFNRPKTSFSTKRSLLRLAASSAHSSSAYPWSLGLRLTSVCRFPSVSQLAVRISRHSFLAHSGQHSPYPRHAHLISSENHATIQPSNGEIPLT